jgi:hypothetical protein
MNRSSIFGRRVTFYQGAADWETLINNEVEWRPIRQQNQIETLINSNLADLSPSAYFTGHRRTIVMGRSPA